MKYFTVLTVVYYDGTADKVAIYTHQTEQAAVKDFYVCMGRYTDADGVLSVSVEARNSVGGVYKNDFWVRPETPTEEKVS